MKKVLIALMLVCASLVAICSCSKDNGENDEKSAEQIKYEKAINLISTEAYEEAYGIFTELGDYKDSAKYRSKFYYVPVKIDCTTEENSSFMEILLNGDHLPLKETTSVNGEVKCVDDYVYGENGKLIKIISSDGNNPTIVENVYDENGCCIKALIKDENDEVVSIYEYTYDDKGRVIKTDISTDEEQTVIYEIVYDDKGNVVSEVMIYTEDESVTTYAYTYNENGTISKKIVNGEDEYVYSYDDNGNWVKLVCPEVNADMFEDIDGAYGEALLDSWLGTVPQEYNMTYDEKGSIKKLEIRYANNDVKICNFTFKFVYVSDDSYDVQGNIDSQLRNYVSELSMYVDMPIIVTPETGLGGIIDLPSGSGGGSGFEGILGGSSDNNSESPIEGPLVDLDVDAE